MSGPGGVAVEELCLSAGQTAHACLSQAGRPRVFHSRVILLLLSLQSKLVTVAF